MYMTTAHTKQAKGSVAVYLLIILQISQEVIINKEPPRERKRIGD